MRLLNCCRSKVAHHNVRLCAMCLEPGVRKRKCCNSDYCDHCYTKNKACPNCNVATRREKLTGATYTLTVFSEHEECRTCLDPGLLRRCCGNYYCDECFYSNPTCRSCQTSINDQKHFAHINRAMWISIAFGWFTTFFVIFAAIALILIISLSEAQIPVGINNYQCYGFFRTCNDLTVCIDMNATIAQGISPLPPLSSYQYCTLNSTVKLQSQACVYDNQLYTSTKETLGYDICKNSFQKGLYIFEDTFENWLNPLNFTSNSMKSALWYNIENGQVSDDCGMNSLINSVTGTKGGTKTLTFYGTNVRYAETKDLDLTTGGYLEVDLFLAPLDYDISHPSCLSNYAGNINIEYSINQGITWIVLGFYDSSLYRNKGFFHIQLEIPSLAHTTATRFRFDQPYFQSGRDGWAMDNVKILKYLPTDWSILSSFLKNIQTSWEYIQYAQCCFDTDWCNTRYTIHQMSTCSINFSTWYNDNHGNTTNHYQIRLIELLLIITTIINFCKFIYISGQNYLILKQLPFQQEVDDLLQFDWILKWIPIRYRPTRQLTTQADDAHFLARIKNDMRMDLDEEEGDGDRHEREEEIQRAVYIKKQLKLKKMKKKLRMQIEQNQMKKNRLYKGKPVTVNMNKTDNHDDDDDGDDDDNGGNNDNNYNNNGDNNNSNKNNNNNNNNDDDDDEDDDEMKAHNERSIYYTKNAHNIHQNTIHKPSSSTTSATSATGMTGTSGGSGGGLDQEMRDLEAKSNLLMSETDRLRRQDISMTRVPFDSRINFTWIYTYTIMILSIFILILFYKAMMTNYYLLHQSIQPFGIKNVEISITSFFINLLAIFCDFKEIYHTLRSIIPIKKSWIPMMTVDSSEGVNSLFIGQAVIPLINISNISTVSVYYTYFCIISIFLGCLPLCISILILRDKYLEYSNMRIVMPIFGVFMIYRAFLGPTYLIKIIHTLYYLFSYSMETRQIIGSACQANKTQNTAWISAFSFACIGFFFFLFINTTILGPVVGILFFVGILYGSVTGTSHELPIKPWLYLTVIGAHSTGVCLHLQKKQKCPCVLWYKWCTDMHLIDEVFIAYTTDDDKFLSYMRKVTGIGGGYELSNTMNDDE